MEKVIPIKSLGKNVKDNLWNHYKYLGDYVRELNQLPDAATVKKEKIKSAPLQLLDMVF